MSAATDIVKAVISLGEQIEALEGALRKANERASLSEETVRQLNLSLNHARGLITDLMLKRDELENRLYAPFSKMLDSRFELKVYDVVLPEVSLRHIKDPHPCFDVNLRPRSPGLSFVSTSVFQPHEADRIAETMTATMRDALAVELRKTTIVRR